MRRSASCLTVLCAALWSALSVAPAAAEDERPVVVELFTSQGCSSCPPADAFLKELATRDGVIALALHVDYWDYIGWKDSFAQARFTERQKGYAKASDRTSVYTPQMVVNGVHDVVGHRSKDVNALIARHRALPAQVALSVTRRDDILQVEVEPLAPLGPMHVYLVRYDAEETVRVERGENAGRKLSYANIVTDWDVIGYWDGKSRFSETVPVPGADPAVVLVQEKNYGAVRAAARLR